MAQTTITAPTGNGTTVDRVRGVVDELEDILAGLDPSRCDSNTALALLGQFARARKTAAAGEALVAARVDECSAHESTDHRSTAHLVADLGGTTIGTAREALATAKRLRNCSATEAALRSGTVSVEQASAITAAAAVDPSAETDLLRIAEAQSLVALTQRAREVKLNADDDRLGRYRRQHAARKLRHGLTDDGMVWGRFELPPDTGAMVVNTLEREAYRIFRSRRSSGEHEEHDRYVADALVAVVTGDSDESMSQPAEVVIHVSHESLVRGAIDTSQGNDGICMIQGAGPIPIEVAREIAEDAFLKGVLVDGTEVVKVKHFGRKIPAAVRTALEVREVLRNGDVRCASDSCDATLGLEWDHREPVARGGPTSYENLRPLCRPHHRSKTRRDGRAPP